MEGNPYSRMVAVVRGEGGGGVAAGEGTGSRPGPVWMRLGRVVSTRPLTLRVAGVEQPAQALRVNERLVKGARWECKFKTLYSEYSATAEQLETDLEAGDEVLLLTEDDQVFYIVMKVVAPL